MGHIKKGKWKPKGIGVGAPQGQHWWALHGGWRGALAERSLQSGPEGDPQRILIPTQAIARLTLSCTYGS